MKNKMLKTFCASILIYILLFFSLKNDELGTAFLMRILYILLSSVLFMMLSKLDGFKNKYVNRAVKSFLIIVSIIGIEGISMITNYQSMYVRNNYISMSVYAIIFMEMLLSYVLSEYYRNNHVYKNMIFTFGIFAIVYLFIVIKLRAYINIYLILKSICVVLQFGLYLSIYEQIKIYNKLKNKDQNITRIHIYSIIICLIECADIIFAESRMLKIILENICLANFLILFLVIVINQIEQPYKNLIEVLQKENDELDELNMQIILKNKQLEKLNIILKQEEELNQTFIRFMPHPMIILNSENNRINFFNKQFMELVGIDSARKIINKKIKKYIEFVPENKYKDYDAVLYVGNRRKYLKTKFLANYNYDSRQILLIEDNTASVQIREMRNEVEKRKQHEHIRTQFLSSISHDLKTPINVIYSGLQLEQIYIEKGDIEALKKYNAISKQSCLALIKFTNNLIDNSKISSDYISANLELVNIFEIVEDQVMSYVDYATWNGIELIFDTDTEECMMKIDVEFMGRIILNLISNGLKYTPKGGKIIVDIKEYIDKICIEVKDTGSGIKEDIKEKIFNKYTSSNTAIADSKSGTGLGLFVVKNLVELQGGRIYLNEENNFGTSIVIEFKKGENYV